MLQEASAEWESKDSQVRHCAADSEPIVPKVGMTDRETAVQKLGQMSVL